MPTSVAIFPVTWWRAWWRTSRATGWRPRRRWTRWRRSRWWPSTGRRWWWRWGSIISVVVKVTRRPLTVVTVAIVVVEVPPGWIRLWIGISIWIHILIRKFPLSLHSKSARQHTNCYINTKSLQIRHLYRSCSIDRFNPTGIFQSTIREKKHNSAGKQFY